LDAQDDPQVWNRWYVIGAPPDVRRLRLRHTWLLGRRIDLTVHKTWISAECEDRPLPVTERLGYVWTTLGRPDGPPPQLLEYYEVDRLVMNVWSTPTKCSGLRIIDNAVDNAHFPFVHPGILGCADHLCQVPSAPEVDTAGVLWSRSQEYWLPITGSVAEYTYRIEDPYSVILYIHRPGKPQRFDFLGIFAQPVDEETFIAHKFLAWVKEDRIDPKRLRVDQQCISAQDKFILERSCPKKLPLSGADRSVGVDQTSLAYRAWLKGLGVRYGAVG